MPKPDGQRTRKANDAAGSARLGLLRRQGAGASDESTAHSSSPGPNGDHAPSAVMLPRQATDDAAALQLPATAPKDGPLEPDTSNTPGVLIDLDAF